MGRVLVIGFGNPLRGDDGLGWVAAEHLLKQGEALDVLAVHQLTPELAEPVSRADLVIFIDARRDGTPGEVSSEAVLPEPPAAFWHHVSPGILLGSAQALYGRSPEAVLFSIAGEEFGYREGLSSVVEAALPDLLNQVLLRSKLSIPPI